MLENDLFETLFNTKNRLDKNESIIKKQPPEGLSKKGVLKKFNKFQLKTPLLESYFDRVSGLRAVTLLKKKLQHWCFQENLMKFPRTPFSQTPP